MTFTTVWPGWYTGRTIHIHFRVRTALDGAEVNVTSQLYFDETENSAVIATSDYQKSGTRTTNATDDLYDAALLMPVTGSVAAGYTGAFTVNLDFGDGTTDGGTVDDSSGSSGPSGPSGSTSDGTVACRVVRARVVRRGRRRYAVVVLDRDEAVTARLRLVRGDDVLAARRTGWLRAGRSTVRLRIPRNVSAGAARVMVTLADRAGNTRVARRRVTVPRRGRS